MRFQVPQFIEKESKLIGPFTLRQFLWFVAGGVFFLIAQFFVGGVALIIAAVVIVALCAAMAYGTVNDVSLPRHLLLGFLFLLSNKKFVFKKEINDDTVH